MDNENDKEKKIRKDYEQGNGKVERVDPWPDPPDNTANETSNDN